MRFARGCVRVYQSYVLVNDLPLDDCDDERPFHTNDEIFFQSPYTLIILRLLLDLIAMNMFLLFFAAEKEACRARRSAGDTQLRKKK